LNLYRQNISFRVAIVILISSLLVAILFSVFNYFSIHKQQTQFYKKSIQQLAIIVKETASIATYLSNDQLAMDVVNGLIKNDIISTAIISNNTGFKHLARQDKNNSKEVGKGITFKLQSPFNSKETTGLLTIFPDEAFIEQQTKDTVLNQAKDLIIYTLVIALFVFILIDIILIQPLKIISQNLIHITPGSEKRIDYQPKHQQDEIGNLTKYINSLLHSMQEILFSEHQMRLKSEELNKGLIDANAEIKAKQDLIEQSKMEAINANHAKSNFLANMSHELRTPMHGILSFASLGKKNIEKLDQKKNLMYFDYIKISADRLMLLLNDLLDLAKLEAGKMEVNFTPYTIDGVIHSCVEEQKARLEELGLTVIYSPENTEGKASFDIARIGQVITNLLSNAIKFSSENTNIEFSIQDIGMKEDSRISQKAVLVSLRDDGNGIPEGECQLVFDRFTQSSSTMPATTKGTGLGLPICKEIIELHHGKIWTENHPDGGAVFSFIIPVDQAKPEI